MVKLCVVERPSSDNPSKPIGIFQAIAAGFDKIAAQPLLLIPPILMDLFLWFGPRLAIPSVFEDLSKYIIAPVGTEEVIVEQLRTSFLELGNRVNLFSVVSSFPVGISTLMAGRRPIEAPVGEVSVLSLSNPILILASLVLLLIIGQGVGAQFHHLIARQLAPGEDLIEQWKASTRAILLAGLMFSLAFITLFGFSLVAVLASLLLPLFGFMIAFLGFSFILWAFIYLIFTPHGIIRYRLGIVRAMMESATLVRWNVLPVVGYLGIAYVVTYLTNLVWVMPEESSWFSILAILGHAFISATLLAGSYAFYQDRRSWLFAIRDSEVQTTSDTKV
jgi:hypothetical protein